jgi:uncharacterized membrane protein YvbJ
LNSESENKQEMKKDTVQERKQERIEKSTVFLWALYAITLIFIVLVVCDNLKT